MILELRNITKSFGSKEVLYGISFCAESGSAFGLLGRNGAGKTTSIRIIMNVFNSDSGEVLIDGRPIDYGNVSFGYLPEERGLYPKKKIAEQLVYFTELKGRSHSYAVKSVSDWLERLSMSEYANKNLEVLSKGNQQKIQLITALAHDPDIIILDEPFSGLDPVNAMVLKDIVREEVKKGKIVILSSHQMSNIEEFCSSIVILKDGDTVLNGNLAEIKRSYPRTRLDVRSADCDRICSEIPDCGISDDGKFYVKLSSPDDKKAMMLRLVENYDIDEISIHEPSLNDIFVEYAGESNTEKEVKAD